MFNTLTNFLDMFLNLGIPGFDCIIRKDGEIVYRHLNGFSDKEAEIPMKGDEHYLIYSCSKPITCTVLLQLFEQGLFKLDDHLADYMPEFKNMTVRQQDGSTVPARNPITIRNLFTMQAGLSYDLSTPNLMQCIKDTNGACQTRETMRYLAQDPLLYEPGTSWQYSLAHDVLAALAEVLTGRTFNEVASDGIFKPLGMNNTTFLPTDEEMEKVIPLYQYSPETGLIGKVRKVNGYRFGTQYASGGAGCVSTVEDYSLFLEGMRTAKLLKPETLKLMTTAQIGQQPAYWVDNYSYGLGVRCPLPVADPPRTDYGWGGAAGAILGIDPAKGWTVYYAQHVLSSPIHPIRNMIIDYLASYR